MLDIHYRKLTG